MAKELNPQTVVRVRQEGANVLLVIDGEGTLMPWQVAIELGKALIGKGHMAEEIAKAEESIAEQALVMRAGLPFGIAANPDVAKEGAKEAQNNSDLRRYLPGGVRATEMVYAPTVVNRSRRRKA